MTNFVRSLSQPSGLAALLLVILLGATAGAFFVAQRLKHEPPLLRQRAGDRAFSPNGDGVRDTARIRFKLPRPDDVTVTILDEDGGRVARVATNRPLPRKQRITLRWDGMTDEGAPAPEGEYSVRVGLRRQGRTDVLRRTIALDLTPPRPELEPHHPAEGDAGAGRGPIVLDHRSERRAAVRLTGEGRRPRFSVWRTDGRGEAETVESLDADGRRASWDGRIDGRPAPPGTYMIAATVRDEAGNPGSAPAVLPPPARGPAEGAVGVWVRSLALHPPEGPRRAGSRTGVTVEAGGRVYRWTLRRVGARRPAARGRTMRRRLPLRLPRRLSGVYVLSVTAGDDTARALIPVTAGRRRPVLVVLPAITWQGLNDFDHDGDGLPDSLARGRTATLSRPYAGGALPRDFRAEGRGLLAFLARNGMRHEVTTDAMLARAPRRLGRHRAVVLAGEARWLPPSLSERLARFVRAGGRVLSLGTGALRRDVALDDELLRDPGEPAGTDALGATVGEPVREQATLLVETDGLGIFGGTGGVAGSWSEWEETLDLDDGELLSAASALEDPVFVGYRLGRGRVIRPGVRGFGAALERGELAAELTMRRIWARLRD